ncbi:MAG: hypothetical protein GY847_00705, partial [Proteobacteria bacterium]|nr:hypothetical protein [Pseudomonadota bacterium]
QRLPVIVIACQVLQDMLERLLPKALSPEELEQIVTDFVARDGPGLGDLPADTFFALWEQFEAELCYYRTQDLGKVTFE